MKPSIYKDYAALSEQAANEIISLLKNKPDAVVCLASGDTPRLTCELLVKKGLGEKVDFSRLTFIGLDEWVGVPPENEGSCSYFFNSLVVNPLGLSPDQAHFFNATASDLQAECRQMDKIIFEKGGIDLMIVGIGMNGHIGFNEPGVSFDNYSHVIDLDESTITVGQKYFKDAMKLGQGITLGLKHLMESRHVIIMANGSKKAEVIKKSVEEKVSNSFPATIIRTHPRGVIMVDESAATLL